MVGADRPPHHQGVLALGQCLLHAKQAEKAVQLMKAAVDLYPDSAMLRYRFALALLQADQKGEAKNELKKALTLGAFEDSPKAESLLRSLQP